MSPSRRLHQTVSRTTLFAWGTGALLYGALAAWGLRELPEVRWPDRTLILAALGALPMPIVLLGTLTTPRHAVIRRFLGQGGAAIFADAARQASLLVATQLALPIGFGLAGLSLGIEHKALLLGAAVLTCGVVGAAVAAVGLLSAAMATIARGNHGAWRAMAGVGFGPAETAPLLYAPALAFLVGLIPAALLTAIWNAAPHLLSGQRAWAATALIVLVGARAARRRGVALGPLAHRALTAIEQAHATPFALAEEAPEPPPWLAAAAASQRRPGSAFLGRAWVRRYPASLFASVLIAVAAAIAVDRHSGWPAVAGLCFAAALYAGTRGLGLLHTGPELVQAARWLGGSPNSLREAERTLSVRLTLPAAATLCVGWVSSDWLSTVVGLIAGAATAAALTRWGRHAIGLWAGRLGLAAALLVAAALG